MRVFVSGLHSGVNPLPGIGVARSIRLAFPKATLIGIDYSTRSSGLSWPEFDSIEVPGNWHELELAMYAASIRERLADDAYWVSCLDLETLWLAKCNLSSRVLAPPFAALQQSAKPATFVADVLGILTPDFRRLGETDSDLFHFAMSRSWRVWLKGPHYSATPVRSWPEFCAQRRNMSALWSTTTDLILQEHVDGKHESVAFVAREGRLLGAVSMNKTDTTPEGKAWAGRICEVEFSLLTRVRDLVGQLNWTGGAEIECIRDAFGQLWLMELNPRFPAWIYGAAICGHNLPALLFGPSPPAVDDQIPDEFVRVVVELPKRSAPARPRELSILDQLNTHSQDARVANLAMAHPSGMPILSWCLSSTAPTPNESIPDRSEELVADAATSDVLIAAAAGGRATPSVEFLPHAAQARFRDLEKISEPYNRPRIRFAYSVKTNPDASMMQLACSHGLLYEAISQHEVSHALAFGADPTSIILNGPAKLWPTNQCPAPVRALFFDSLSEFRRLSDRIQCLAQTVGFRLRPTNLRSRFGVSIATDRDLDALCAAVEGLPHEVGIGLHFHQASSVIGLDSWLSLCESVVGLASIIEKRTSRRITLLDVGGGFTPRGWDEFTNSDRLHRAHEAISSLPYCHEMIFELGKALAQPSYALLTRILEVSRNLDGSVADVVCDASIAEAPIVASYPHRLSYSPSSDSASQYRGFIPLAHGPARLLGRLCMEDDVLSQGLCFPETIQVGDLVAIEDVGAYDTSMSYEFGQGKHFRLSAHQR